MVAHPQALHQIEVIKNIIALRIAKSEAAIYVTKGQDMWYSREGDILKILIYVQPGAKSTEMVGFHDGALKIRLNAPPVDGRANGALQKFLAQLFNVPNRNIKLISGDKNRRKRFSILGSNINPESFIFNLKESANNQE